MKKPAGRALPLLAMAVLGGASLFALRRDIVEGNPNSSVKVVIYEDLECGDCAKFRAMLDQKLLPKYGSRVAFVHRDFPLGKHEWARQAAIAGRWVEEQNPSLEIVFRREIMSEQDHLTLERLRPWLQEFARRNNLSEKGILDSLDDKRLHTVVDQDYQGGVARGVIHTPTVIVGGQKLVETILYEDVARALDTELGH